MQNWTFAYGIGAFRMKKFHELYAKSDPLNRFQDLKEENAEQVVEHPASEEKAPEIEKPKDKSKINLDTKL